MNGLWWVRDIKTSVDILINITTTATNPETHKNDQTFSATESASCYDL